MDQKLSLPQLLFSFSGRIPRLTYWAYGFVYFFIYSLAFFLDGILGTYSEDYGIGLFSGILSLVGLFTGLAVSVKRCHDRDHSGWYLLLGLIPLVNILIGIELGFFRGTEGTNRFGVNPLMPFDSREEVQTVTQ